MTETFQTISPIDGTVYAERRYAGAAEIAAALASAVAARAAWRETSVAERARLCTAAVDALVAEKQAVAEEITWQMGRPIRSAPGEVAGFEERARHMIAIAPEALADTQVAPVDGFTRFIRHAPLGVVLTIAPWNYPYLTAVNSVIPALMAGNPVILKHSAQTPICAERFAAAFEAAGLPQGVFQHLHLGHDDTRSLIAAPEIDFVAFTGSVAGGRMVEQAAAGRFIGAGLELGGKDPAYVRPDADLAHAAESLVDGAFFNSGQSCCGIERIYVHADAYDAFVDRFTDLTRAYVRADADFAHAVENLVDGVFFNSGQSCCGIERIYVHGDRFDDFVDGFAALTRQYVLGDPLDAQTTLGPMVKASAATFVAGQIADAVRQGARPLIEAAAFDRHAPGSPYMAPQVLVDVNHQMGVMREESFGPVVGIMKVADDSEAVTLMNDSPFGLTASIWTADLDAAERIGDAVETGTVFMNRCDYLDPALVWTGVKDPGRGATLSRVGYETLTRPKSFHLRHAI